MHPAPPLNAGASPFATGAPLFRTMPGESLNATPASFPQQPHPQMPMPMAMPTSQPAPNSPFAVPATSNTSSPLTVGDVLPQLPAEVARFGALSPDQPVAIAPQMLDAALRSGQAALPMFEIYRVCPALFQTPISPQDPRMIPLPASKLARLIATAQQAPAPAFEVLAPNAQAPQDSPFGFAQPSPFGAGDSAPPAGGTLLPPRRQGPPPSLVERDVSPQAGGEPQQPAPSPFANPFSATPSVDIPGASPFGVKPEDPLPAQPGLFAPAASPEPAINGQHAPFGAAATTASPFGIVPANISAPPTTPTPSIFGNPGAPPASPFGGSSPAPASPFGASPAPAPAPVSAPSFAPQASSQPSPFSGLFGSATPPPAEPPAPPPPPQAGGHVLPTLGGSPFGGPSAAPEAPAPEATSPFAQPSAFTMPKPPAAGSPFPPAPAAASAAGGSTFRVSFVSMLKGRTNSELGFDPAGVPAWIMTSLPTALVREQLPTGTVSTDLGTLVDGITDVGFRNVLSQAKRNFQLTLPIPELTSAMTAATAPAGLHAVSTPASSPQGSPTSSTTMRIEPPTGGGFGAPAPSQPQMEASAAADSSFQNPGRSEPSGASSAFIPLFNPAPEPAPQTPSPAFTSPSAPAPLEDPPASAFGASSSVAPSGSSNKAVSDPFAPPSASATPASRQEAPGAWPQPRSAPMEETQPAQDLRSATPTQRPAASPEGLGSAELLSPPEPPRKDWASETPAPAGLGSAPQTRPVVPAFFEEPEAPAPIHAPARAMEPEPEVERPAAPTRPRAEELPSPPPPPAAAPAPRPKMAANSLLGLQPLDTSSDQILLRALLGTEEDLTPQRVVDMTGVLPGIAACVCIKDQEVFSHAGARKPQAREFQRQAADLAHHLRTLGPLIGIDGAETFTLNAGDRLMTFCFPDGAILGILHDAEPSLGLRDKITLIARELSRMLA